MVKNIVQFSFGYGGPPTNPGPVRAILDALNIADVTVYYESGHTIDGHSIWSRRIREASFSAWHFHDFDNFNITNEKPTGKASEQIHRGVGGPNDRSLFGWVAKKYSSGWLTCDDGPGEVADFIHVGQDGTLRLIHVKSANVSGSGRGVAVAAYEQVVSQAIKNVSYIDSSRLLPRLEVARSWCSATWTDGARVNSRTDFLEALQCRRRTDVAKVIIVQPHLSELTYKRLREGSDSRLTAEVSRLNLLEDLLNSARATVIGMSAEFEVFGSRS